MLSEEIYVLKYFTTSFILTIKLSNLIIFQRITKYSYLFDNMVLDFVNRSVNNK